MPISSDKPHLLSSKNQTYILHGQIILFKKGKKADFYKKYIKNKYKRECVEMAEFLPLCDVLFNVISLAGYFCDVVFDVVFCYALLERGRTTYFAVVIILVIFSLLMSQVNIFD